jgi:hypothetical protein
MPALLNSFRGLKDKVAAKVGKARLTVNCVWSRRGRTPLVYGGRGTAAAVVLPARGRGGDDFDERKNEVFLKNMRIRQILYTQPHKKYEN